MKRLLALVAGGLGLRAFLKRRSRPAYSPSAEDLRAKLAQTKTQQTEEPARHDEPVPHAEPESEPEPEPEAQPATVDDRRADAHAKARQAIDDLGKP
jgi:hypothetical protein